MIKIIFKLIFISYFGQQFFAATVKAGGGFCGGGCRNLLQQRRELHETESNYSLMEGNNLLNVKAYCSDLYYDLFLVTIPGVLHFFLYASSDEYSAGCPSVGFDSRDWKKVIFTANINDAEKYFLNTFQLGNIFSAFDQAKLITNEDYSITENSCLHFAANIWRPLGVVENVDLQEFIVSNIVEDDNTMKKFFNSYSDQYGVLANSVVGKLQMEKFVQLVVSSQLQTSNTSQENQAGESIDRFLMEKTGTRNLFGEDDESCMDSTYNVDAMLFVNTGYIIVGLLLQPKGDKDCNFYYVSSGISENNKKKKIKFVLEDGLESIYDLFTGHVETIFEVGLYKLQEIADAFHKASVDANNLVGENYSFPENHLGHFSCNIAALLNHNPTIDEAKLIEASIKVGDPYLDQDLTQQGKLAVQDFVHECLSAMIALDLPKECDSNEVCKKRKKGKFHKK